MDPQATIRADATGRGEGGTVVLWSQDYTGFYGNISARGGALGGNAGMVETSSHDNLQALGLVDAAAPAGKAGLWLLDPANVTISNAATSNRAFSGANPHVFAPATRVGGSTLPAADIVTPLHARNSLNIPT